MLWCWLLAQMKIVDCCAVTESLAFIKQILTWLRNYELFSWKFALFVFFMQITLLQNINQQMDYKWVLTTIVITTTTFLAWRCWGNKRQCIGRHLYTISLTVLVWNLSFRTRQAIIAAKRFPFHLCSDVTRMAIVITQRKRHCLSIKEREEECFKSSKYVLGKFALHWPCNSYEMGWCKKNITQSLLKNIWLTPSPSLESFVNLTLIYSIYISYL